MALQEIENDDCFGLVLDKLGPHGQNLVIPFLSRSFGFGLED